MAAFKKQICEISSKWKAEKYSLAGAETTLLRIATAKWWLYIKYINLI